MATAFVVRAMTWSGKLIEDVTTFATTDITFTFSLATFMCRSHWRIRPRNTFLGRSRFIPRSWIIGRGGITSDRRKIDSKIRALIPSVIFNAMLLTLRIFWLSFANSLTSTMKVTKGLVAATGIAK